MKKLLIVALALFTLNGMAQEERKGKKDRKEMRESKRDMSPEAIADIKSKRLTLKLDLSDKQQKQVHRLILDEAKDRQKMRQEREANKTADAKPSKEDFAKRRNERLDKAIAMKRQMKSILTPEQYAEFEKMKPRKHKRKSRRGDKRRQK